MFAVCSLRESPFAVLKMAKSTSDAKALGLPLPEQHFTCYSCRGTCGCAGCKKAIPTDKTRVKYSPAVSAVESGETPEPAAPSVAAPSVVSSSAAQEKRLVTPNAQYSNVEGARPHANANVNTPPLDSTATRVTPPGHSPLSDVETSISKWYVAMEKSREAGKAQSSINPSGHPYTCSSSSKGPRYSPAFAAVSVPWSLPAITSSQGSSYAVGRPNAGIGVRDVEYTVAATRCLRRTVRALPTQTP